MKSPRWRAILKSEGYAKKHIQIMNSTFGFLVRETMWVPPSIYQRPITSSMKIIDGGKPTTVGTHSVKRTMKIIEDNRDRI